MVLVSVIFPIGNITDKTRTSLECVLNQTYEDCEVLAIDNMPDLDVREKFSDIKDKRLIWLHEKSTFSAAHARNIAIEKSSGEFLAIVDSDDYIFKDHIEVAVKTLKNSGAAIYYCGYLNSHDSARWSCSRIPPESLTLFDLLTFNPIGHSTVVMRSSVKPKYALQPRRHDLRLWIEHYMKGHKFVCLQEVKVRRNLVKNSLSARKFHLISDHYKLNETVFGKDKIKNFYFLSILILRHIPNFLILSFRKVIS